MSPRFRIAAALLFALALPLAVRAQDSVAEAKRLYAEGQAEYNLGHFDKALELYEGAYKHKAVPALLFNIAQCHRQLGRMREAATTYKAYLRTASKKDPNRIKAEALLAEVEAAVKKNEEAQSARPLGTVPKAGEGDENKPQAVAADHDAPPDVAPTEAPAEKTAEPVAAKEDAPKAQTQDGKPEGKELAMNVPRSTTGAPPPAVEPMVQTTAPSADKKSGRTFTWVAAGGTALALGGGALFGMKSKSGASDLTSTQHTTAQVNTLKAQVASDASKANLLFGVGVAMAAVTATFFVLEF